MAQVSPAEVTNPHLKALEQKYLQQLIVLNRQISAEHHAFPFVLSRYVGVDPKDQPEIDTRGLEFVYFHQQTLLKFSGNSKRGIQFVGSDANQRAAKVFTDVVAPVLRLLPQHFAANNGFDGFGFEISYHVLEGKGRNDYEGRENLVVVMAINDALRFSQLTDRDAQQKLLNQSEIYISGERYGLALGQADPLLPDEIAESSPTVNREEGSDAAERRPSISNSRSADANLTLGTVSGPVPVGAPTQTPAVANVTPLSPADVDQIQAKYQSALDQYGMSVRTSMGQTSSVAPSLALFRNSLYLQITLRNPHTFDMEKTSLYKRAALSFDTFLAPHLADLVSHLPGFSKLEGLDITVLVSTSASGSSAEAVEFVCPLPALRSFIAYEISNQDLIQQSLVIVNGVRISLNLQQVE